MDELLFAELTAVIKEKKRHKYYKRTVDLAKQYKQIITNEDIDDLYKQVAKRESGEWFEQRKRLTNLILMPMAKSVLAPLNKVARSNDLRREIKFKDDSDGKDVADLERIMAKFAGTSSLDYYTRNRFLRLTDIDPNAWIVIEWQNVLTPSTEYVTPYPYEVRSAEAIYYKYDKYVLQYLVVCTPIDEKAKLNKYTIYGQNQSIVFKQFDPQKEKLLVFDDGMLHDLGDIKYIGINKQFYQVIVSVPHNLGYVPAFRTGYHMDEHTDETTCVNMFHCSLPYFMDSVKAKSEKDLTFALHTFPIRIQYEQPCPECNNGTTLEGSTCTRCKGTGTLISTSTQETITFPMPRSKDEFFPLDSILTYVRPPADIIDIMIRNIDALENKIWSAVWGNEAISREEITQAVTATEKLISEQAKYDKLYTCAEHLCRFWTFAANTIAKVTSLNTNLEAIYMTIGKEFSVKSKAELMAEYQVQKTAGMSHDIVSTTERELMKLEYSSEPKLIRRYDVRAYFRPFSDKTSDQINVILSDKSSSTLQDRILWTNYDVIWDNLELEDQYVYEKPLKEIKKILYKAVDKMIAQINLATNVTVMPDLSSEDMPDGGVAPLSVEAEAKAKLKGTVGGIQGLIEINKAVFEGVMSEKAAELLIMEIYGFNAETAKTLIELPEAATVEKITEIKDEISDNDSSRN